MTPRPMHAGPTVLAVLMLVPVAATASEKKPIEFTNVEVQTREFLGYERSIALDAAQTRIREEGLSGMPAPCCDEYSIATCCCPCNLARSVWGLANYLISEQGASAREVEDAARRWIAFTNEDGYRGDACAAGGCGRAFAHDGCGGMDTSHVVFD